MATPPLATLSIRPRTATRLRFGVVRWTSVKPATSRTALLTPTSDHRGQGDERHRRTSPMTAIGSPQPASASRNAGPSRVAAASRTATIAPSEAAEAHRRVERADAGFAHPEQLDRSDDHEHGHRMPRTNGLRPEVERRRGAVRTASRRGRDAGRRPGRSRPRTRAVAPSRPAGRAADAIAATPRAVDRDDGEDRPSTGPPCGQQETGDRRARRTSRGPRPRSTPTLAATSCAGVRAIAGRSDMWSGRVEGADPGLERDGDGGTRERQVRDDDQRSERHGQASGRRWSPRGPPPVASGPSAVRRTGRGASA